jgi:SSS family solute:Na+ symporter
VLWGTAATAAAWFFSHTGETTIELVNRVGSALYGPVLAVFVLAWRSRRADGRSAVVGAIGGVGANLVLAAFAPGLSWLWWNVVGFAVAMVVGVAFGSGTTPVERRALPGSAPYARTLVAFFGLILGLLALVTALV